jgi:hypothetical protein
VADVSTASVGDLSDVTITSASTNELLKFNGSAWVNSSVAYSEVTGTPSLATVATSGSYADLSNTPTLGTASAEDVGTATGDVVQLVDVGGSPGLPVVDGSQLTGITADLSSSVIGDLSDVTITSASSAQVLKYNGTAWVNSSVAYAEVTGTPSLATVATTGDYADLSNTPSLATVATTGAYSDLSGAPTLGTASAEDVGTSAGNVVQLNGSAQLPAVDGSLLTNITADVSSASVGDLSDVTITSASSNQVLKFNGSAWVNARSLPLR